MSDTPQRLICDIYRSPRDEEMYLYVAKADGLGRVPEELLERFGKPKHALTLVLTPERKLVRAEAPRVMQQIAEKGFYLQLPPPKDPEMQRINVQNTKVNLW